PIDRTVPRLVEFELLVERFLFQVRQQKDAPAVKRPALAVERGGGRQHAVLIVEVGQGSSDLIQIVLALDALGRFPSLGDNRDQQQQHDRNEKQRAEYRSYDAGDGHAAPPEQASTPAYC